MNTTKTLIETGYSLQVSPDVDFDTWFDCALDERKQELQMAGMREIRPYFARFENEEMAKSAKAAYKRELLD